MIPARIRSFHDTTIKAVTGWSRTTRWRHGRQGKTGADIVRYLQEDRAANGLPPLDEQDILIVLDTLAAIEDARSAKLAENAADQKDAA